MAPFSNPKRLCCWAGLTPDNNESAGKKKSDKSPYYKQKYERIMKRHGKKRAIIAIARMILTAIYQILSTGEGWNPTDLYKIDMPEPLKEKTEGKGYQAS